MNRLLHSITGYPDRAPDRRWVIALFAELTAIEGGAARLRWLFGAMGMLAGHYTRCLFSPVSLVCVGATLLFGSLALTEYEGLAVEDDWYPLITLAFAAVLICVSAINLKRQNQVNRP